MTKRKITPRIGEDNFLSIEILDQRVQKLWKTSKFLEIEITKPFKVRMVTDMQNMLWLLLFYARLLLLLLEV